MMRAGRTSQKSTFVIDEADQTLPTRRPGLSQPLPVSLNISYPSSEGPEKVEGFETRGQMLGIIKTTDAGSRGRMGFWLYGKS